MASYANQQPSSLHAASPAGDSVLEEIFLAKLRVLDERVSRAARAACPDLAEIRELTGQIVSTRRKLAAAQGEPPPHTD